MAQAASFQVLLVTLPLPHDLSAQGNSIAAFGMASGEERVPGDDVLQGGSLPRPWACAAPPRQGGAFCDLFRPSQSTRRRLLIRRAVPRAATKEEL